MSANFMNETGLMAGVDIHKFLAFVPPSFELPIETYPYLVGVSFDWFAAIPWNRLESVTADARKTVDVDFALFLVPHMAFGSWGPNQPANLLKIVGTSGSEVSLGIGSVTGKGDPLAACIHAAVGWNLNCWENGDHPSGNVLCVCSVQTKPSWIDYALAAFKWLVVGYIAEKFGEPWGAGLKKVLKRLPQAILEGIVKQAIINALEQVAVLARYIARTLGF